MAKPTDFFVGIADLFSIILPGAAIAYICLKGEEHLTQPVDILWLRTLSKEQGYIAFFVVAYLLGHLLDMAGSLGIDQMYESTQANWKRSGPISLMQWFVMQLRRSGPVRFEDSLFQEARRLASPAMVPGDRVYQWSRSCIVLKSPSASAEIERLAAISNFFRGMVMVSTVTLLLLLLPSFKMPHKRLAVCVCLMLAFVSFVRFCELRWKAVQQTYRFFIALHSEPTLASTSKSDEHEAEE